MTFAIVALNRPDLDKKLNNYFANNSDTPHNEKIQGDWPGGVARVITIYPDSACPEIVFEVGNAHGEIGVFAEESVIVPVSLLTDK